MKKYILAAAFAVVGGAAQAATLTFYNDAAGPTGERFELTCSLGCEAWDGAGFSTTTGDLFDLANSSEALEISTVNAAAGTSFTSADFTKTDGGGATSATFTSDAEYILIKVGLDPNVGIVYNTSPGNEFTFTQINPGSGLSHYSEFGTVDSNVDPVPLPATGLLLLAGLGGMFAAKKRRKS